MHRIGPLVLVAIDHRIDFSRALGADKDCPLGPQGKRTRIGDAGRIYGDLKAGGKRKPGQRRRLRLGKACSSDDQETNEDTHTSENHLQTPACTPPEGSSPFKERPTGIWRFPPRLSDPGPVCCRRSSVYNSLAQTIKDARIVARFFAKHSTLPCGSA